MDHKSKNTIVPVILSGGMGARLWPLSRQNFPKQFFALNSDDETLIQETAARINNRMEFTPPVIVCGQDQEQLVKTQMRSIGIENPQIILEPCCRNTAPAAAVAALYAEKKYDDVTILLLPADHIIKDTDAFIEAVLKGVKISKENKLITFGIKPTAPKTGFGYIKHGKIVENHGYEVESFVEKPALSIAKEYCKSGDYLWNSGIFMFQPQAYLSELEKFEPDMVRLANNAISEHKDLKSSVALSEEIFSQMRDQSIDYAVMEHTDKAVVIRVDCGWSDVGSWESLWEIQDKDEYNNVLIGDNQILDTESCYINSSSGPAIAAIGVSNISIISTDDVVLVMPTHRSQDVKQMTTLLKQKKSNLIHKK